MPGSESGRWVKGLIHLHSCYSDGLHSPASIKRWAQDRAYEFMILTDHLEMFCKRLYTWFDRGPGEFESQLQTYVIDCNVNLTTDGRFITIPGLEIASVWRRESARVVLDQSTSHLLALDITDLGSLFESAGPLGEWTNEKARRMSTRELQAHLHQAGALVAPAHQFSYSSLTLNAAQPLAGSDYRYDMDVIAQNPGVDFYYRTHMDLDHEAEDIGLYTGTVRRWLDAGGPQDGRPLPWAYTGSDLHVRTRRLGREQLSHATWVYVQGDLCRENIIKGIAQGHTCATRGRSCVIEELHVSPTPGGGVHTIGDRALKLSIKFARPTSRPSFISLYRDGVEVSGFKRTFQRGREWLTAQWDGDAIAPGLHAYVVVVSGRLVTSPILIHKQ